MNADWHETLRHGNEHGRVKLPKVSYPTWIQGAILRPTFHIHECCFGLLNSLRLDINFVCITRMHLSRPESSRVPTSRSGLNLNLLYPTRPPHSFPLYISVFAHHGLSHRLPPISRCHGFIVSRRDQSPLINVLASRSLPDPRKPSSRRISITRRPFSANPSLWSPRLRDKQCFISFPTTQPCISMGQHDAVVEKHWIPVHSGLVSLRCQWLNKGSFQGLCSLKGKLTANGFVICITRGIQQVLRL